MFTRYRKFQVGVGRNRAGFLGMIDTPLVGAFGNVGSAETDLASVVLQANSLYKNGMAFKLFAHGYFAANGNNKRLRAYFGSALIVDSGVLTSNDVSWYFEAYVIRRATAIQHLFTIGREGNNSMAFHTGTPERGTAVAEAETADITVRVSGEGVATDDIVCSSFLPQVLTL